MKLNKIKALKTDIESCLASIPKPSEFVLSEIRNGSEIWNYECRKGGFLYLLGEVDLYEGKKPNYTVCGLAIKECEIATEQPCSVTLSDKTIVYVAQSYKRPQKWNKATVLKEMKEWLEYKAKNADERIKRAEEQKSLWI